MEFTDLKSAVHNAGPRGRVLLRQLPLAVTLAVLMTMAVVPFPEMFTDPFLVSGLALVGLLTAACGLVPWERLPAFAAWIIPLLDFAAIAMIREGGAGYLSGLGLLMIFPAFWLAWSDVPPLVSVSLIFTASLLIVWLALFTRGQHTSLETLVSPMVFPLVMSVIGWTAAMVHRSGNAQRRVLEEKDRRLRQVLAESEHRAKLLDGVLNTIDTGVIAVGPTGAGLLMNAHQLTNHRIAMPPGIPDPNESQLLVFGKDRTTPVPPDERPVRRAALGESFSDELVWIGEGNRQRALCVSARVMRTESGGFDGSVIAFSDVTDSENALAAKDDFVQNVSHELRTPLTSIVGHLEIVLDERNRLPDYLASSLDVVHRNARQLHRLADDLLSVMSERIGVTPRLVSLNQLVRSSLAAARPPAQAAGIELTADLPEKMTAVVDPQRISQVLDNLLSNAIKYSPDGGTVRVRLKADGPAAVLSVEDTGIGMGEEDRRNLFTRFFRSDAVRRASIPGMGLGLSITKSIVEAHGGTIAVSSENGRGTTFTVTLPTGSEDG